jgi:hypothetical protein
VGTEEAAWCFGGFVFLKILEIVEGVLRIET